MAEVSTVVQQPPEFIEAAAKPFITQLQQVTGDLKTADLSKIFGPQFVAGQDPLQQQAQQTALAGIGGYKPFLQAAQASTGPTGYQQFMSPYQQDVIDTTLQQFDVQAQKGLPALAASGVGAYQPYLTAQESFTGPQAYQSFMSPYQQDVIDATLAEYDSQAAQGLAGIGQQAAMSGNLGGGREGVMRAQYQNKSDMNRALLQSGLLQQGFTQANQLANQAFGQQMQLGQNQQGLAAQVPGLYGQDISTLGSAGATQQAQQQAQLDATREANRLAAYEPYERLGFQQTGVASIASGAPGQYQSMVTPNPTPLQNALGIAGVAGGLMTGYGDYLRGARGA